MKTEQIINSYKEFYPNIFGYKWEEDVLKKGIIIIVHGMSDHSFRYHELATYLSLNGFIVYAFDLIGHGKSIFHNETIGIINAPDFSSAIIECINHIYEYVNINNQDHLPLHLFAHSMGSMMSQRYIELYPEHFEKVILSGTDLGNVKYKFLELITKRIVNKHGMKHYSNLINNLSLKAFDKKFKKEREELGWLSINQENIKKYILDPFCNHQYPVSYYYSLAKTLNTAIKKENLQMIKAKQILLISGSKDPVSNFAKSTKKLNRKYLKNGICSKVLIYDKLRHEYFHEDEKTNLKVFADITKFYQSEDK